MDAHRTDEQLAALLDDRDAANPPAQRDPHVANCLDCRKRLDALTRVVDLVRESGRPVERPAWQNRWLESRHPFGRSEPVSRPAPGRWRTWLPVAAAAALLLALSYPSYLGIVRLPSVSDELEAARESIRSASVSTQPSEAPKPGAQGGVVPLHIVPSPRRGGASEPLIRIGEPASNTLLGLAPAWTPGDPDRVVTIRLERQDGTEIWSTRAEEPLLFREKSAHGLVFLTVPSSALAPGRARILVTADSPAPGEVLLDRYLTFLRDEPAPN
jgi:hypothetical protein